MHGPLSLKGLAQAKGKWGTGSAGDNVIVT